MFTCPGTILFPDSDPSSFSTSAEEQRASLNFKKNIAPGYNYDADYSIVASGTKQVPNYPDLPNCDPEVEVIHRPVPILLTPNPYVRRERRRYY
jgi:hypothetical protein